MLLNQLDTKQGNTQIIITTNIPTAAEVRAEIESKYWPDVLMYVSIAVSIGCIMFLLGKIAG